MSCTINNPKGNHKKATIVIPNYNGLAFMEPCFKIGRASCRERVY